MAAGQLGRCATVEWLGLREPGPAARRRAAGLFAGVPRGPSCPDSLSWQDVARSGRRLRSPLSASDGHERRSLAQTVRAFLLLLAFNGPAVRAQVASFEGLVGTAGGEAVLSVSDDGTAVVASWPSLTTPDMVVTEATLWARSGNGAEAQSIPGLPGWHLPLSVATAIAADSGVGRRNQFLPGRRARRDNHHISSVPVDRGRRDTGLLGFAP